MKKSVIFVEPSGSEANVFDNYMKLPLMGTLYLGTILHNAGYQVKILNENILGRKLSPLELNADVVCISSLTVNANRARELAAVIKKTYPQNKILIGGIHASLLPEEFKHVADHIVTGEAENIIVDLVEGKYADQLVHGSPLEDLDTLPLINYSLLENARGMNVIPVMTSRGCPFNCNFCTVTKIFGKKFRKQSIERVIREIRNALEYFKNPNIFFYDDNFTSDKKRVNELADRLISDKLKIFWTAQVRTDVAKDELLLSKLFKAGCERFYIGFESIDDQVLESYHKSQTKKDIEAAIDKIHDYGISIHGMFMFGDTHDTLENIDATAAFAIKYDVDTVQFMILTPFPGTEVYEKLTTDKRILHHNWDFYDGMHVVFEPYHIPALELQKRSIEAYKKFYSINRTLLDLLYFIYNISFDAFVWNFKKVDRYDINNLYIKMGAKFILREFLHQNKSYVDYLEGRAK